MRLKNSLTLAFLLLLVGCGGGGSSLTTIAAPQVALFHQRLNAGEYHLIYDSCGEEFKAASTEDRAIAYFESITRKLGKNVSAEQTNWGVKKTFRNTTVVVVYKCIYERGETSETFTFLVANDRAELVGFRVEFADMMIN